MVNWSALVFILPAESADTPAGISIVTRPSVTGVNSALKVMLSDVDKSVTLQFPVEISEISKPDTHSENSTSTITGDTFVGFGNVVLSITSGTVPSYSIENTDEASLLFPARSLTTPAGICISIKPSPAAEIEAVKEMLSLVVRFVQLPFATDTSPDPKLCTSSLNSIVTSKLD